MSATVQAKRHRCRHKFCPNRYDDVIGGDGAFGSKKTGAECMPCFYAAQFIENGQTPEQIEGSAHVMEMMLPHLEKVGWNWNDVKAAFERMKTVNYAPI